MERLFDDGAWRKLKRNKTNMDLDESPSLLESPSIVVRKRAGGRNKDEAGRPLLSSDREEAV